MLAQVFIEVERDLFGILLHLTMIYVSFVGHIVNETCCSIFYFFILTILHLEANHCIYRSGIKIEESNGLNHIGVSTRGKIE